MFLQWTRVQLLACQVAHNSKGRQCLWPLWTPLHLHNPSPNMMKNKSWLGIRPLILALRRHRQAYLCKSKASLTCIVSSICVGTIGDPVSKNSQNTPPQKSHKKGFCSQVTDNLSILVLTHIVTTKIVLNIFLFLLYVLSFACLNVSTPLVFLVPTEVRRRC